MTPLQLVQEAGSELLELIDGKAGYGIMAMFVRNRVARAKGADAATRYVVLNELRVCHRCYLDALRKLGGT